MLYTTDAEKVKLALTWLERIRDDYGKDSVCLGIDLNIAIKEISGTKWEFQRVCDAMGQIIEKHRLDDQGHVDWDKIHVESDQLYEEAGWGAEEYHWECIRHTVSKPPFCACWNISPENDGINPLPLNE